MPNGAGLGAVGFGCEVTLKQIGVGRLTREVEQSNHPKHANMDPSFRTVTIQQYYV